MKIRIILDKENYIKGFADIGDFENSIEIFVPNSLVLRNETYNTIWDGEKFVLKELIEVEEKLNTHFIENYRYYKYDNENLKFDEEKKKEDERVEKETEKTVLQNQIIDLEMRKKLYQERGWETNEIDKQLLELEDKLLTY